MRRPTLVLSLAAAMACLFSAPAMAYIGPGAGITLFSAIWGVIVAVFLAIGAVLLWPVRILLRRRRNRAAKPAAGEKAATASGSAPDRSA